MKAILVRTGNATNIPLNHYMTDTVAEMNLINTTYEAPGTDCYVIDDGVYYVLNSKKEWKINNSGGPQPGGEVIYDGGRV